VTAISIFDEYAGAEESHRRGFAWIEQNLARLLTGPASAVAGPVIVHTLGLCHATQSGQTPQAFTASHQLGRWFHPSGGGAGFRRAERDATERCDGMIYWLDSW
jgi:hypothetical protein